MGKTQPGAVWLDPKKTSPFDFYQYWRNVADADVRKCIRMLTFLPLEQIDRMDKWKGAQLNTAKEILAFELTKLVHGEEEESAGKRPCTVQPGKRGSDANHNTAQADSRDGSVDILGILVAAGLCPTRSEARRNVQQGGVTVNGEKSY